MDKDKLLRNFPRLPYLLERFAFLISLLDRVKDQAELDYLTECISCVKYEITLALRHLKKG